MMPHLNRREWLKTSALSLTGLLAGSGLIGCRGRGPATGKEMDVPREWAGKTSDLIRLNSNESPYGISDKTRSALIEAVSRSHLYPHRRYPELKKLIAEREGVPPESILLGAGSTELMTMLIQMGKEHGRILAADPTYFDFLYYADQTGCPVDAVPLTDRFEHDLQAMEKAVGPGTGLVYICNPNNPTGSITPADALRRFCARVSERALVVVDEAYHEYAEDASYASMLDQVGAGRNLVVTRTFSKIYGMAGLRVGYGVARPDLVKELDRLSRNFAPVAVTSLSAAMAAWRDEPFTSRVRGENRRVKALLAGELEKRGVFHVPSHTNFVLFKVDRDANAMAGEFEKSGILVRPFSFHGSEWIRVTLGTAEQIRAFLALLPRPA